MHDALYVYGLDPVVFGPALGKRPVCGEVIAGKMGQTFCIAPAIYPTCSVHGTMCNSLWGVTCFVHQRMCQ